MTRRLQFISVACISQIRDKASLCKFIKTKLLSILWCSQKVPETCQTDSTAVEEDQSCSQPTESAAAEQDSNRPQQPKNRHFRQRSASDTTFASLNLSKLFSSIYLYPLFPFWVVGSWCLSPLVMVQEAGYTLDRMQSTRPQTNKVTLTHT